MAKWNKRSSVADVPTGPKEAHSTVLSLEDEAVVVAFRRHTLLPLDDCLYALQPTLPHLTRSSLHRCLQRHGISRLPDVEGVKAPKRKFKSYPIGYFHIDIAEAQTPKASSTSSSPSIGRPSSLSSNWLRRPLGGLLAIPPGAGSSRSLQDPHSAHRQRNALYRSDG